MDIVLAEWYTLMRDRSYYASGAGAGLRKGKFLVFCEANGLGADDMREQLAPGYPLEQCVFLRFDRKFPLCFQTGDNAASAHRRYERTIDGMDAAVRDHYVWLGQGARYADTDGVCCVLCAVHVP